MDLENLKILFIQNFLDFVQNFSVYIILVSLVGFFFLVKKQRQIGEDNFYDIRKQKMRESIKNTDFEKIKRENEARVNQIDFSMLFGINLVFSEDVNFLFDYYKKNTPAVDTMQQRKSFENYAKKNSKYINQNFREIIYQKLDELHQNRELEIEMFFLYFLVMIFPRGIDFNLSGAIIFDKKIVTRKIVESYFKKNPNVAEIFLYHFAKDINSEKLDIGVYLRLNKLFANLLKDDNFLMSTKSKVPLEIVAFSELFVSSKKNVLMNNRNRKSNIIVDEDGMLTTESYEIEKKRKDEINKQHENFKAVNSKKNEVIDEEQEEENPLEDVPHFSSAFEKPLKILEGTGLPIFGTENQNKNDVRTEEQEGEVEDVLEEGVSEENIEERASETEENSEVVSVDESSVEEGQFNENANESDSNADRSSQNDNLLPEVEKNDSEAPEQNIEHSQSKLEKKEEVQKKKKPVVKKEFVSLEKHWKFLLHELKNFSNKQSPYICSDEKYIYINFFLLSELLNKNFKGIPKDLFCKTNESRFLANFSKFLGELQGKNRCDTSILKLNKFSMLFFKINKEVILEKNKGFENIVSRESILEKFAFEREEDEMIPKLPYEEFEKNIKEYDS